MVLSLFGAKINTADAVIPTDVIAGYELAPQRAGDQQQFDTALKMITVEKFKPTRYNKNAYF